MRSWSDLSVLWCIMARSDMDRNVSFPGSSKRPNKVLISVESPGHPNHMENLRNKTKGHHAGLATLNLNSDIPMRVSTLRSAFQPRSKNIKIWRILHVASNCRDGGVQSDRNHLVEVLTERGLVDSYGQCHHNKDWNATHLYPPRTAKMSLVHQYAFVTAFYPLNPFNPLYNGCPRVWAYDACPDQCS